MANDVIKVRGLHKTYGKSVAVDDVDLDVRQGEIFALLGPNGAGKTTTVEVLEGYRSRDRGEVSVLGRDPGQADSTWRSRIGVVLQSNNDLAELSVAEVIRHFRVFYSQPRQVDEVLDLVGLQEKRQARIRQLSGGQRRRLDVALGILGCPELVFLDEPTTGFDPEARRQFWRLILRLAREGTTLLLTTHYLEEAEALADRVAIINQGRVLDVGAPAVIGGRDRAPAVVSWTGANGRQSVTTATPTLVVRELSHAAGDQEIADLEVARPTLEDIYLQMIGATP